MVEYKETEPIERFNGKLESSKLETMNKGEKDEFTNLHMVFEPTSKVIIDKIKSSKTKRLHNYIRMPKTVEASLIPDKSGFAKYLRDIEAVFPECKKLKTWNEIIDHLKDKNILYVEKVIGTAFEGYEGRKAFVPQQLI